MMGTSICYLNGKFVDVAKARISPLDRGFLLGEGLFETWRTYRGRPYAIAEHLARMTRSAGRIGIDFDPDEPWQERSVELARRNRMLDSDGAVRMTITRGRGPVSLVLERTEDPTRLMLFRPLEPGLGAAKRDGVAVHLVSVGSGVSERQRQIKSLNYLPAVMARTQARERGCFEALYHLDCGKVLEGTTSNVFAVKRGVVRTTPISMGLLPGVTRHKVIKLARSLAKLREEVLTLDDLAGADEVFLTSSSIEIVPVVRVGRRKVGNGRVGELTRGLQRRYRENVARELDLPIELLGE
ncbi:MAG: aminotransferase class IV [Deltaproteobacteria bacterium]|nr:aminotransferase class IV [Deltaproteobacteria bacterium]